MSLAMLKTALCCVTLASLAGVASAMPTDCGASWRRRRAPATSTAGGALRYCSGFATEAKCDAFGNVC
ncbi:hypothetical protein DIPPA_05126 [Diplonema papillatum]|nr:hypothetical protein DIPPA_05126 [Diplonema papillatum]